MFIAYKNPGRYFKKPGYLILAISVFIRLFFFGYPPGDDYFRYAWEGKIQHQQFNPYNTAPNHQDLKGIRDITWSNVNHPDLPAIYPPLSLVIFKFLAINYPSPTLLRVSIFLSEILALLLMFYGLKTNNKPGSYLIFYGWNPLVLIYFLGELHLDAFLVPLITAFVLAAQKRKFFFSVVLLTLASSIKILPLIFSLLAIHKKSLIFFPMILVVPLSYVCYTGQWMNFGSLWHFSQNHSFNNLLNPLFQTAFGNLSTLIIGGLFLSLCALLWLTEPKLEKLGLYIGGLFILLSPTVHPWYLSLLLPFLVFTPTLSFLFLCCILPIGLLPMNYEFYNSGLWQENRHGTLGIWLSFYGVFIYELFKFKRTANKDHPSKYASISLIIPCYNEEKNLPLVLQQAAEALKSIPHEIIVVDGNSTDNTQDIARRHHCRVLECLKQGRGYQINLGLNSASNDVSVFMHADCRFNPDFFQNILDHINNHPDSIGGWNLMKFQNNKTAPSLRRKLQVIQRLNNIRARYLGISFGDQCQFVITQKAKKLQLVENMPLMEDVNLSLNIKAKGSYTVCPQYIKVSTRRWESKKSNSVLVVKIVFVFLFLKKMGWFNAESRYFEKKYYGSSSG